MVAQCTVTGILLHIPEVLPALWRITIEGLWIVGQYAGIELVGNRVGRLVLLGHRLGVRNLAEVEFLYQSLIAAPHTVQRRGVDHIPHRLAGGALGSDHRPGVGGALLDNGDAQRLGHRVEDGNRLCFLVRATLGDESDFAVSQRLPGAKRTDDHY